MCFCIVSRNWQIFKQREHYQYSKIIMNIFSIFIHHISAVIFRAMLSLASSLQRFLGNHDSPELYYYHHPTFEKPFNYRAKDV